MSILKNASYLFSSQVLNLVIGFVSSIYSTRLLGPEGRGMSAIFNNGLGFTVILFGLSINYSVIYFVNSGKIKIEKLLSSLLAFCLGSSVLVYLSLVLLKQIGLLSLALPEGYQSTSYMLLIAVLYFNRLFNAVLVAFLTARKEFKYQSALFLFPGILSALIYMYVFYAFDNLGENAFDLVVAVTAGSISINLLLTIIVYSRVIGMKPSWKFVSWSEAKEIFNFSVMNYVGNVLGFLILRMDFWIIDNYWGKTPLGIYAVASQLAQLVWVIPASITPLVYSYSSEMKEAKSKIYAHSATNLTLYICLILSLLEAFTIYFTVTIVYGIDFEEVRYVVPLLLIGILPYSIVTVLGTYFSSRGKNQINLYGAILGFVCCLILYPVLVKSYSIYGAAIASGTAYLIRSFYTLYYANKEGLSVNKMLNIVHTISYIKEISRSRQAVH